MFSNLSPRSAFDFAKHFVNEILDDRVMTEAAAVTFYALLALFPALGALVSLCGLILDPAAISRDVASLSGFLPGGGMQLINEQLRALTAHPSSALGLGAITGLLISLWSANAGTKGMFDALNAVYDETEARGFLSLTLATLLFTLGGLAFVLLVMGALVVLPIVWRFLGVDGVIDGWLAALRWPGLLLLLMGLLSLLYRFGPHRKTARWRWISWGSAAAACTWLLVSWGFSFYVEHFGNYDKTYGSLGAAIGFMTWIWISTIVILAGAELDSVLETRDPESPTPGGRNYRIEKQTN